MKQVLQNVRNGQLEVAEVPQPQLQPGGVLVRNRASLISVGTEKMLMEFAGKSMLGKARERPDLVRQVLDKVKKEGLTPTARAVFARLDQPLPLGYSCAGVVEEVGPGAEELAVGQAVACAGMGYASHAERVFVPRNLTVAIPSGVSFDDAAYVTVGSIALQGVRVAEVSLGETVAVVGLGLLGQLTVQILKAAGCRVLGIDLDRGKVERARDMGADVAVLRGGNVEAAAQELTVGVGVDAVIITAATESNDPTELAGRLCRDRGIVSMVGAVRMDIPRKLYYEKELQLRLSRSYGPGRYDPSYEEEGHDYPIAYVRWTERRNMGEFLRLIQCGHVKPSELTTHRFPIEDAEEAYDTLGHESAGTILGALLTYPEASDDDRRTIEISPRRPRSGKLRVGFIGAGNFARTVLLPRFAGHKEVELAALATATGASASSAGRKFGFQLATTDPEDVLGDASVDAVVIATRHGTHAPLAVRALEAGKAVFLEKPLAVDREGLQAVIETRQKTQGLLYVGYNRRFSPLSARLREHFAGRSPLAMTYRANAGAIPAESWVHHPEQGGGRIIGEACHFIDLIQYVAGAIPEEVFAYSVGGETAALNDTVAITLRLHDGSIATIDYFSVGDPSVAKERLEVFGGGSVGRLDDFRRLDLHTGGKRQRTRGWSQQKGFDEEVAAFVRAARGEAEPPIPFDSLVRTSATTFAIMDALRTGCPAKI